MVEFQKNLEKKKQEIEKQYAANSAANQGDEERSIAQDYDQHRDEVIAMLIKNVMTVDITIPRVVKGNFEDDE